MSSTPPPPLRTLTNAFCSLRRSVPPSPGPSSMQQLRQSSTTARTAAPTCVYPTHQRKRIIQTTLFFSTTRPSLSTSSCASADAPSVALRTSQSLQLPLPLNPAAAHSCWAFFDRPLELMGRTIASTTTTTTTSVVGRTMVFRIPVQTTPTMTHSVCRNRSLSGMVLFFGSFIHSFILSSLLRFAWRRVARIVVIRHTAATFVHFIPK